LSDGGIEVNAKNTSVKIQLNTLGSHNVRNAIAASAVAIAAGISLEKIQVGLESFIPVNGRMQAKTIDANHTLIDDSYNANPDSVRAAIDALKQSGKNSWIVLGDMGEVGDQGPAFHQEVGAYAAEQGISKLFALGEQCQFAIQGFEGAKGKSALANSTHFSNMDSLIAQLRDALHAQALGTNQHLNILVKGSRFMRMERVVQALLEEAKACS
jgi:UDP-N-acetylmuramoyl-tripeptide--D-alanyl-D-alanine ligase